MLVFVGLAVDRNHKRFFFELKLKDFIEGKFKKKAIDEHRQTVNARRRLLSHKSPPINEQLHEK